jgi:Zn-finger nucleic acid-binding protein
MSCFKCPVCEIELCFGQHNDSSGYECPSCGGPMKVLNSEDF